MMSKFAQLSLFALAGLLPMSAVAENQPKPKFVTVANHYSLTPHNSSVSLKQWTGGFTDLTHKAVTYTMVGANPDTNNTSTWISVVLIPVKMVYGPTNGNMTFNPNATKVSNGLTVTQNIVASPIFKHGIDFVQGGVDLGNTQYIDAFQRGNFWSAVSTNTNYHTMLGAPKVVAMQAITVTQAQGNVENNPFGAGKVGTMTLSAFDSKLQAFMRSLASQINPGVLPIFITNNIFLTKNGCCIGGYHSADGGAPGGQTYVYGTYVAAVGSFSQDVSILSHEVGEWLDDPFVSNAVNCTDKGFLEVGDPLENGPNYGDYPYTLKGFTYNLQSLVFLGYFGAPRSRSVNSWLSFQNDESNVCPGQ